MANTSDKTGLNIKDDRHFRYTADITYTPMSRTRYVITILILGLLAALMPFSVDMYLPGFSAMAEDLHTSIADISLSLSSFFIGITLGQLLYGPLLDRFGRKGPLYIGLFIYSIASVAFAYASTLEVVIVLRFIQAVGSTAAAVASMAMVRDLFPVEDNAKVFSLLVLIIGASPLIAPTAGGYLTAAFGWQAIFLFLALLSLVILLAVFVGLPEAGKANPALSLKAKSIAQSYRAILKVPAFKTYAFSGSMAFAGIVAYVSGSPIIFMEQFHISEKPYGLIIAALAVGFIAASQFNTWLLRKYKSEDILRVSILLMLLVAVLFLSFSVMGWLTPYNTVALIFLFLFFIGLINPNATALSLAPFSSNAGTASALLGALQMGLGALTSLGVSALNDHTATPVATMMTASALISSIIIMFNKIKTTPHTGVYANNL